MFFDIIEENIVLRVRLTPGVSSSGVRGMFTDSDGVDFLKIGVLSPPEKGKANQELIKFLAKWLGVAKSDITIVSGELSHYKKILLKANKSNIVAVLGEV